MTNRVPTYLMAVALSMASPESLRPAELPRMETYRSFRPGEAWNDTDGNRIEAHGGGMFWENGTYYWFGEHGTPGRTKVGVMCYSSRDLYNWKKEGVALPLAHDNPKHDLAEGCALERPKVVHNAATRKYVMWFHLELKGQGYDSARSAVAVSDRVTGPYTYLESFRPDGSMARDMTLFVDDDGKAYQLYASEDNQTMHVSLLTDDYLRPSGRFERIFVGRSMEAPTVFKHEGLYYFIGSGCTGYSPNAARSAVARSMWGPWQELGNPCVGSGADKTFFSQSTYVLPVKEKPGAFIFMADRWEGGRYVWLPVHLEGRRPVLRWLDEWDLSYFDLQKRGEGWGAPLLYRKVAVPAELLSERKPGAGDRSFGGDIRMGDLDGDGRADFLVHRSAAGGMKPCFLGAFDESGKVLWRAGSGGEQPLRPGPVALHDIDGDRSAEVICFFVPESAPGDPGSMEGVSIQIRDGKTGSIEREAAPLELARCRGEGSNWIHQRILVANLEGGAVPRQLVVKLGESLLAFGSDLRVLWSYRIAWNDYERCSAYIPAVGDMDGDGRDEILGGYYLLDHDGRALWERPVGLNMDSVAIAPWDGGTPRAICSGFGQVLDRTGKVLLALGPDVVPHGQEVRVADFILENPGPEMVIRHRGHEPDAIVVGTDGKILHRFRVNESPNQTGMETVYWFGTRAAALLYNGGQLWFADGARHCVLPELPPPVGEAKMGWYHCIPGDVCGDEREEAVLYDPWDASLYIFTPRPLVEGAFKGYRPGPRQYNARLMD